MPIERDSLNTLQKKITHNYLSTFKPLENTTKYNILKTMANVDAGIYHQLLGDLEFLSKQIFPDTATGEYLRSHWSDKVAPLYGQQATGNILITGKPLIRIPAGCVFSSTTGNKYYTTENYRINENGQVLATVLASDTGTEYNLAKDSVLTLSSNLIAGMDSDCKVVGWRWL